MLIEDLPSEEEHVYEKEMHKISSISSLDSLDQEVYCYSDECQSDDLDKLSMCLSEVSEKQEVKKAPVIYEIINSQLALWTLVFSFLYSYAWKQHRKKFLMSMVFVVPTVMIVLCTISSLLTVIVILGRIFSTPIKIDDMLKFGHNEEDDQAYPRRRSLSGTSCRSSLSGRSSSTDELLPKPFCRKHSMSNGSLNQLTFGSQNFGSNGAISGISSGSSNGSTNRSPTYLTNGRKFSYNSYTPIETHDETANTPKSAI